jgi:hypothetical protein
VIRYEMRGGTWFTIDQSEFAGPAHSTCMKFEVDDVYATVKELSMRGVVFEEYDVPGVQTVDGVAEHASGARGTWFKDLNGNILQMRTVNRPMLAAFDWPRPQSGGAVCRVRGPRSTSRAS